MQPPIPVYLARSTTYDAVFERVHGLLDAVAMPISPGARVLVKPNFLRADMLSCTHASVIAAACRYLRDKGCVVTIGDSPGFGTVAGVGRHIGLHDALAEVGCSNTPLITLDSPQFRPLSLGGRIGLSRYALEADCIVSIPKLKAHSQMRVTCGVKNLFGCVAGIHKALLHARHGDKEKEGIAVFPSLVVDIMAHLPPVTTLLDGVTAMHVTGPSGGRPYNGGLLAASVSPVALDTVIYSMLGVLPGDVPVWRELQRRNIPGALQQEVQALGEPMESFDLSAFMLPFVLKPETFNPVRLMISTLRRLWARFVTVR